MRTSQNSTGFTLVEVLIIAPIVILFIGAFIGLAVALTSDSLRLRERNAAAYNVQDALNEIEADVSLATSFNTTTGTLTSPQGKNNSTTAFTNTTSGQPDTLILKSAATTKSLYDPTRELIYTGTGACDARNPLYQLWTIFFVSNGSLYKRTILPQQAACAAPWQRTTCAETHVASNPSICQTEDSKLLDGISTFDVSYFTSSADTTAIADSSATDANSVAIDITLSKQVVGEGLDYSGNARVTSLNASATDSVTTPPPSPPAVTWTSAAATPYTTTFQWSPMGNASGYNIRYRLDNGTWVNGPQGTTATSYNVVATHRKQIVEAEVTAVTASGNISYGSASRTIPRWQDCTLLNGWQNYGSPYAGAGFTRTSAGVVGLRGLVRYGTVGASTPACILPVGFRPAQNLIFQSPGVIAGANDAARVDVMTNGEVRITAGESGWVSLSGITFLACGAPMANNWANGTWQNGWTNYLNGWGDLKYGKDTLGRVHTEGLGRAGTITSMGALTSSFGTGFLPSHQSIYPARAAANGAVDINTNGQALMRYVGSWASVSFVYYPSTFNSWSSAPMINGWVTYGAGYPAAQCYKSPDDLVIFRGLVKSGANGNSSTSLEAAGCGIHADGRQIFPSWIAGNTPGRIDITDTGILIMTTSAPGWTTLDGIRYIAD